MSLCLPPVIEAKLVEHVAGADATPIRGGSVSNIQLDVGTVTTPRKVEVITNVREVAPRVVQAPSEQPFALGGYEPRLKPERVKRIQLSLCVAKADGIIGDATRAAVDEFFRGVQEGASGRTYPSARQEGIQAVHEDKLLQAEKEVGGRCDLARDKGPFEIGQRVS